MHNYIFLYIQRTQLADAEEEHVENIMKNHLLHAGDLIKEHTVR